MATASAAPVVPAISPSKCTKISSMPHFSSQRVAPLTPQSGGLLRRENGPAAETKICRREIVKVAGLLWALWKLPEEAEAKEVEVGSYLPPSSTNPSFVLFKATAKDTPALRAGNVQPYQFILPPTWKQLRVANILSGNYCQPKCAEPWVEVKFEDEKQGKIQVVASPLIRLTNKPNATLEDIGSPEKLIASLGPFVTGNTFDPDELVESSVEQRNGQTYYSFVLETPYASTGTHNLAKATAKGNTVVLFVASANDKQWPTSQKILKEIVDSFNV